MNWKKIFNGVLSLVSSLLCVVLGVALGYVALLIINPDGATEAITNILKNFLWWPEDSVARTRYFAQTVVYTAPLLMCALSILFSYKVGLFNIGASGQYMAGAGIAIYSAIAWQLPWWACLLLAVAAGAVVGSLSGALKAYCNVNEVISGIMFNWIILYSVNMLLSSDLTKSLTSETYHILHKNPDAILPTLGLEELVGGYQYFTIAVPIAILMAILVWVVLNKTKFGYELRATGNNKNAAKYSGMKEKQNIIITMCISGALAGLGAALFYLTDIKQWEVTATSVDSMGFNGIAVAFLGCLNPIGSILAAFFIQHITFGGSYVDLTVYSSQVTDLISSLIIYLCGFVLFFKYVMSKLIDSAYERRKREAEAVEEAKAAETFVAVENNTDGGDEK